jgi:PAS domain S-box-containing protein
VTLQYALWAVGVTALIFVGTAIVLRLWTDALRHEGAEAAGQVARRAAEARARAEAERRAAAALAASERRHRALTEAGAIVVWRAAANGRILALDGWAAFTGQDPAEVLGSAEAWLAVVAPEDRGRLAVLWSRAVAARQPFDAEFRVVVADGAARWCRARAVLAPDADPEPGSPGEWIGVIEDIDGRRRSEEARMLLAREVNHRAKNMLAVVQAVLRLTSAPDPDAFVAAVSARIAALGRAHDLLARRDWGDVSLGDLAAEELAAYLALPAGEGAAPRLRIDGPPVRLAAGAVQPIAIALHELAVNAAKYGALSPGCAGQVTLNWERLGAGGGLRIVWAERGGPPLVGPPARRGFGTRVVDATVSDQLGGRVHRSWLPEGLRCELILPESRIGEEPEVEHPATERVG